VRRVRCGFFDVGQIEARFAVNNADRDRGAVIGDRVLGEIAGLHQSRARIVQRNERAADGGRASAAVGLERIAVENDLSLAELVHVNN